MGLKDRLAGATPRTAVHHLRIEDDSAARAELAAAQDGDDDKRIKKARAALDACYEPLNLTAMPLPTWDDLVTQHPPSDEWRARGRFVNPHSFLPPALVQCVADSGVGEDDWRDYINGGALSPGEAMALLDDLLVVHDRSPDVAVPKGSGPTRS